MRDRGVSNPGFKAVLAATLALVGGAVALWVDAAEPGSPQTFARNVGIVTLVIGLLAVANYLYTLSLIARLKRGEGVLARWVVSSVDFASFRDAERSLTKRKNNWKLPAGSWAKGLPVIFGENAVVAGNTYFRLLGKGISRYASARIEHGSVRSVEFAMRLTAYGAMPMAQTARYRGHLRIPIARDAGSQAARVVSHFEKLIRP